jgi:pyruvate ferredoxin oxidoreductase beta subunit
MGFHGPCYIQIDTPCPAGWSFPSDRTLEVGRLGVNSGLIPLFEMENGVVTRVRKIKKPVPVEAYLKAQGRFKHLFTQDDGAEEGAKLHQIADSNIRRYGLVDAE